MLSIYNYRDLTDFDDTFPIAVYEEIEEKNITTEDKIRDYLTKKELYDCIKYLFTSYFLWFVPKDADLKDVGEDFFEYIDNAFREKFDVGLFELLGEPFLNLSVHMIRVEVMNFVKFLHEEIPQFAEFGDIYYTKYADIFKRLGINLTVEIIREFKRLKVLEG